MSKKGKKKKSASNPTPNSQNSITLRQEKTGNIKPKSSNDVKPYSKLQHLEKLSIWAAGQASIPSLAAFYGQRLAATAESQGIAPDPSVFSCLRCETILQPGFNCSVRIEKNKAKRCRGNKCKSLTQNNVVYYCHHCSCRNVKRGTPQGYMKALCPSNSKAFKRPKYTESGSDEKSMEGKDENGKECETLAVQTTTEILAIDGPSSTGEIMTIDAPIIPPSKNEEILTIDVPLTPPSMTGMTLLESKKRRRNKSTSKKQTEPENSSALTDGDKTVPTSKRRRKKSWTSLKEIAETNDQSGKQDVTLAIPFSLQGTF